MYYKVKIKNKHSLGPSNWKRLPKNIIMVSLDNRRSRELYLSSILEWSKKEFHSTHILLADTLQRYNISFENGIDIKSAKLEAYKRGNEWIKQSIHYLNNFSGVKEISRWDDWLIKHDNTYKNNFKELLNLYKVNSFIREGVDLICNEVWERRRKSLNLNLDMKEKYLADIILPYFLEETALLPIFLSKVNGVCCYPGKLPQFWNYFIENEINFSNGWVNRTFLSLGFYKVKGSG